MTEPVIMVRDPVRADAELAAGGLSCRSCGQPMAPWRGPGRSPGRGATTVRVRPKRARCRGCRATEVLLPAQVLPRCSAGVELVGQVLMAATQGTGHLGIAASLDRPTDTLRRWLRRARANADRLRGMATMRAYQFDPDLPPLQPQPTALAEAVDALAVRPQRQHASWGRSGPRGW